jgi:uncharacterized membrane protein
MTQMKQILVSAVIMLLLDAVYLDIFGNFFNDVVMKVQGSKIKFKFLGALLCYILLIAGLNYFIINKRKPLLDAFILGIVIYGVYETTTYAILENWSRDAMVIDTLWGGILFTLTTYFTYTICSK